jgi:flagellar hook-length control protein FliK
MATDLLFSPSVPQNPVSGIYKDKIGASDSVHSTKIKTARESNKVEGESFLSTLRSVSKNFHRNQKLPNINRAKHSETKAPSPEDKMDETSEPAAALNEEMPASGLEPKNSKTADSDQAPAIRDFINFIKILEEMGFYRSDGGADGENLADSDSAGGMDLAGLKLLMARLKQNEPVSSADLQAAFERLRQFIAGALGGNTATENAGNGQSVDLAQESARIFQWLKELVADPHHPNKDTGMGEGKGSPDANPSESATSDARRIVDPAVNSIDLIANSKAGDAVGPSENAGVAGEAQSRGAGEPDKGGPEKLASWAQVNENPKETTAVEKTDADPSRPKVETDFWRETKTPSQVDTAHQKPAGQDQMRSNNTETTLDNQPVKQSAPAGIKVASGSLANELSQTTAGEEPVSRLLQEAQSLKDGDVKVSSGMKEETVGKVIKTEAGTNDPSLLNPQSPPMEKSAETTSLPKEADSDRSGLKTETLDQIVQKAAIHLRNGQHEARIDLKPEYLGHIRMQVISENHQVTVRILTEHGFVKDMIQNNAHQLKADLQHQGLNIDKLEVTVSHDSDGSGNPKDRLAGTRIRQSVADNGKQGPPGRDLPQDRRQPRRTLGGATTVDYFA